MLESRIGDTLEFTVSTTNSGNDTAEGATLTSILEPTLQYEPGSLAIVTGANTGSLTDSSGDDQAEYIAGSRSIVFRLGTGANAVSGGQFAPGGSATIRYRATVSGATTPTTLNIAMLLASGLMGAPLDSTSSNIVEFQTVDLLKDGFE